MDTLQGKGYKTHLANPAAIQKYKGMKYSNDSHDAFWLAHMLRLGILPEGYIYPKECRPVRDLLRKRGHLVQLRTSLINSLQGIISRNCGCKQRGSKIKRVKQDHITPLLAEQDDLQLRGVVSKETIDFLTLQIKKIEGEVLGRVKKSMAFPALLTMPGVGNTLAMTIAMETGTVSRFPSVGDFASSCRKVPSTWESNDKIKGRGNSKDGNKYLAWAFSEAEGTPPTLPNEIPDAATADRHEKKTQRATG